MTADHALAVRVTRSRARQSWNFGWSSAARSRLNNRSNGEEIVIRSLGRFSESDHIPDLQKEYSAAGGKWANVRMELEQFLI